MKSRGLSSSKRRRKGKEPVEDPRRKTGQLNLEAAFYESEGLRTGQIPDSSATFVPPHLQNRMAKNSGGASASTQTTKRPMTGVTGQLNEPEATAEIVRSSSGLVEADSEVKIPPPKKRKKAERKSELADRRTGVTGQMSEPEATAEIGSSSGLVEADSEVKIPSRGPSKKIKKKKTERKSEVTDRIGLLMRIKQTGERYSVDPLVVPRGMDGIQCLACSEPLDGCYVRAIKHVVEKHCSCDKHKTALKPYWERKNIEKREQELQDQQQGEPPGVLGVGQQAIAQYARNMTTRESQDIHAELLMMSLNIPGNKAELLLSSVSVGVMSRVVNRSRTSLRNVVPKCLTRNLRLIGGSLIGLKGPELYSAVDKTGPLPLTPAMLAVLNLCIMHDGLTEKRGPSGLIVLLFNGSASRVISYTTDTEEGSHTAMGMYKTLFGSVKRVEEACGWTDQPLWRQIVMSLSDHTNAAIAASNLVAEAIVAQGGHCKSSGCLPHSLQLVADWMLRPYEHTIVALAKHLRSIVVGFHGTNRSKARAVFFKFGFSGPEVTAINYGETRWLSAMHAIDVIDDKHIQTLQAVVKGVREVVSEGSSGSESTQGPRSAATEAHGMLFDGPSFTNMHSLAIELRLVSMICSPLIDLVAACESVSTLTLDVARRIEEVGRFISMIAALGNNAEKLSRHIEAMLLGNPYNDQLRVWFIALDAKAKTDLINRLFLAVKKADECYMKWVEPKLMLVKAQSYVVPAWCLRFSLFISVPDWTNALRLACIVSDTSVTDVAAAWVAYGNFLRGLDEGSDHFKTDPVDFWRACAKADSSSELYSFKRMAGMALKLLAMCVTNAYTERGVSIMNYMENSRRLRMKDDITEAEVIASDSRDLIHALNEFWLNTTTVVAELAAIEEAVDDAQLQA